MLLPVTGKFRRPGDVWQRRPDSRQRQFLMTVEFLSHIELGRTQSRPPTVWNRGGRSTEGDGYENVPREHRRDGWMPASSLAPDA